jgi:hypothetical protein
MDKLVHAPWSQGGSHHINNSNARIDVADELSFAL